MTRAKLPDDVEADQVWRDPSSQHYKVFLVRNGVATLQRCTPAGRVLNQSYRTHAKIDRMQAGDWTLVSK